MSSTEAGRRSNKPRRVKSSIGDVRIEWEIRGKTVVVTAREIPRVRRAALRRGEEYPVLGDGPIEGTMTSPK